MQDEDKSCSWICEDGLFRLKAREDLISLPIAIAFGVLGGVILGLIGV
jgi:hypothetical protein